MNIKKEDAFRSTSKAALLVEARIPQSPRYGVYIHAKEQLAKMMLILNRDELPEDSDRGFVDIGLMAAKELEASDPELADALMEADYDFKHFGVQE